MNCACGALQRVADAHDWQCDCTSDDPCRIAIALTGGPAVDEHPGLIERWRRSRRRCTTCGQRWSTPPCSRSSITGQSGHTYGGGCGDAR